ncbi:MAG TPA: pirin-like C-terminal cupin domain-containing protein, partial [Candidatus Acidoferrales bacterium]|nr:pirin-like C-terminal cupin domain-containing protein [Candidatus Acidoferrales bacterium]
EEIDGGFAHHADGEFPLIEGEGVWVKVVLGEVFGHRSPVATFGDPVYVDYRLQSRARLVLPAKIEERALSVVSGELEIDGQRFEPGTLVVLKPKSEVVARADISTQLVLLGGPKLDGPRHVWWNFVSSSKERIEAPRRTGVQGDFLRCPAITNSFHWPE